MIERTLVSEMNASNSHVVIGIALLCVVLLISPVIILLVRMMTRTLQVRGRWRRGKVQVKRKEEGGATGTEGGRGGELQVQREEERAYV